MVNLPTLFDASTVAPVTPLIMSTDGPSAGADHLAATRYRFVPADMRAAPCWMVARGKVPHRVTRDAEGGVIVSAYPSDHHDPTNHCTFADAMEAIAADRSLGLGFVLGVGNDFVCVDTDDLEKVTPEHQPGARDWQSAIRERFTPLTYSEVSRSGKGWHFIGRCPTPPTDKASVKHPEYHIDLLLRSFLVVTGDHQPDAPNATTEIANITPDMAGLFRKINEGDGPATAVATLPTDGVITPGRVTDAKQLRLILSNGKNGEAFRDGRKTHDWSTTFKAILNATAQFCTDEQLAYQVIATSGLVQLAEDKGSVSRSEKLDRLWAKEWRDSLIKTEPSRRADAAAHVEIGPLTLADLWEQSPYVQFMVKDRAKKMITEGLLQGKKAEELAPLFLYLKDREQNRLENDLRLNGQPELAQICMDARVAALKLNDVSVVELDDCITRSVKAVQEMDEDRLFGEYNGQFYIVEHFGGKPAVFSDPREGEDSEQSVWAINNFCAAKVHKVLKGIDLEKDRLIYKPFSHEWVQSQRARRYIRQEMRFDTTEREISTGEGLVLNLFCGWATLPTYGAWPALHYLIRNIICDGSDEVTGYVLNYLAHIAQKPWELPGVAIVLQSPEQGAGKGLFLRILTEVFGSRYCFTTGNIDHVIGRFNSAAMNKVLLMLEEALPPNDRNAESRFKNLTGDNVLSYERKGLDAIQARNFARVFITSNQDHVAHVNRHDRRHLVLRVSPKHATKNGQADPMWKSFHEQYPQELAAFMYELWTRDISQFDPRRIPHTDAKKDQVWESVTGPDRILRDFLLAGRLPRCSHFDGNSWMVRVSALSEHFNKNNVRVGNKTPMPGRVFKEVANGPARPWRMAINGQPAEPCRVIDLPTLAEARRRFLSYLKFPDPDAHDWGDTADMEWTRE